MGCTRAAVKARESIGDRNLENRIAKESASKGKADDVERGTQTQGERQFHARLALSRCTQHF